MFYDSLIQDIHALPQIQKTKEPLFFIKTIHDDIDIYLEIQIHICFGNLKTIEYIPSIQENKMETIQKIHGKQIQLKIEKSNKGDYFLLIQSENQDLPISYYLFKKSILKNEIQEKIPTLCNIKNGNYYFVMDGEEINIMIQNGKPHLSDYAVNQLKMKYGEKIKMDIKIDNGIEYFTISNNDCKKVHYMIEKYIQNEEKPSSFLYDDYSNQI